LALFRDELVGWVKSMDAYRSGGKGADRQHYLSMWSRSPIKIDRKSSPEPIIVARPCLSVVGGIQPDVLPDLVEHASRDDGFIDRCCSPTPTSADRWTNEGIDEASQAAVERLFSGLYDLVGAEMPSGDVVPRVARLGPAAMALWGQWYDENAAEQRDERLPSSLKGTWAKLPSQLARLALILHVGHAVDAGSRCRRSSPSRPLADAPIVLVDYFKEHARAALGELRTPRSTARGPGAPGAPRSRAEHGPDGPPRDPERPTLRQVRPRQGHPGAVWLRCVFCGRPVAPNDPVACRRDRARMEAQG
jgi:hypothetical protein